MAAMIVLGAIWGLSVLVALPKTVLTSSWDSQGQLKAALPQGWAFFTRDPQASALMLYEARNQGAHRADSLPQSLPGNAFGLLRGQRSQDTEKAILSSEVKSWTECGGMLPDACVEAARSAGAEAIDGVRRAPNFCGQFVVALSVPTPFPFRNVTPGEFRLTSAALVDVKCA